MDDPTEDPPVVSTGSVDESALLPLERDRRFVVRFVLALLVGLIASCFVAMKVRNAAGTCGAGLIRPGSSVIPPRSEGR